MSDALVLTEQKLEHPFLPLRMVIVETFSTEVVNCYCGYVGHPGMHSHYEKGEPIEQPPPGRPDIRLIGG